MRTHRFPISYQYLVILLIVTLILFSAVLFNLWYPNGFEDLMINQEWQPVPNQPTRFVSIGEHGKAVMRKSTATIVGVGRDVADRLPHFLAQVETLSQQFNYSQAVFVEGDSSDNSRAMLLKWAAASPKNRTIVLVSNKQDTDTFGNFKGLKLPREGRLSIARNVLLSAVRNLTRQSEYVVMVDMDVIGWNLYGIRDSFGRTGAANPHWDVMCGNGIILHGLYRDTYAFRSPGIDTNHHKMGADHDLYNITGQQAKLNRANVRVAKTKVKEMMDSGTGGVTGLGTPFEVESCFGGVAIYR